MPTDPFDDEDFAHAVGRAMDRKTRARQRHAVTKHTPPATLEEAQAALLDAQARNTGQEDLLVGAEQQSQ